MREVEIKGQGPFLLHSKGVRRVTIRSLQALFIKPLTQLDVYLNCHTGIWVMECFQKSLYDALILCPAEGKHIWASAGITPSELGKAPEIQSCSSLS